MGSLPGGFTNATRRTAGNRVEKTYQGVDRRARAALELACLERLAGLLPVPAVIDADTDTTEPMVVMAAVGGRHGQVLLDTGNASLVLRLAGELLRELQGLAPVVIPELRGSGSVIVHGDFGPQNLLIDDGHVSALLDWEFAHRGDPIEDLAWAEWIVRMHHRRAVDVLGELHRGAGLSFDWPTRHGAMVRRCEALLHHCERHHGDSAEQWRQRLQRTETWTE